MSRKEERIETATAELLDESSMIWKKARARKDNIGIEFPPTLLPGLDDRDLEKDSGSRGKVGVVAFLHPRHHWLNTCMLK